MELRLKLWHIITFFVLLIIGGSITIGLLVQNNNENISRLNKEIKAYDKQIKHLTIDYKALEVQDEQKTVIIDSLMVEIGQREARIKGLTWNISKIKKELENEKDRIRALDSTQQFELARTNIELMLRLARSGGN